MHAPDDWNGDSCIQEHSWGMLLDYVKLMQKANTTQIIARQQAIIKGHEFALAKVRVNFGSERLAWISKNEVSFSKLLF